MANTDKSFKGSPLKASTPIPQPGYRVSLLTAADAAWGAMTTAWVQSQILDVRALRRLALEVAYDGAAGSTTGAPQILPMLCSREVLPAIGDDVWFIPGVTDGVVTAAALAAGAIGAGSDFTITQSWGKVIYRPIALQVGAMLAASDKIRCVIDIDVTHASWFALQAREGIDGANPGTLTLAVVGAN